MRCYRKILHISYKDHVTNDEVRAKIQPAIGPHEDLLTIVKRRKTAVVWSCFPFIRSGQNHLPRHSERGKKTKQTEQEVAKIQQAIRPHRDLLTIIKRCKLQWYGHVFIS